MKKTLLLLILLSALVSVRASDTLTVRQVYNFDVGDTFDYVNWGLISIPVTIPITYTRSIVVGKSITTDSIIYTISHFPIDTFIDTTIVTHINNLILDTFLVTTLTHHHGILPPFVNILGTDSTRGLTDSSAFSPYSHIQSWDSTYNDIGSYCCESSNSDIRFAKGLGMTFYKLGYGQNPDPIVVNFVSLIYHANSQRSSGIPYYSQPNGFNDLKNANTHLYPNPTSDQLHLSIPKASQHYQFIISDLLDKELLSQPVTEKQTTMSISHLASGLYTWRLVSDNAIIKTGKVVKE